MAEENVQEVEQKTEPQGEAKTDWKAEARKWEARAKKSQNAEQELEALKQSQMTEQEKLKAKAEKAEAELAELKAEQQRIADAYEISQRDGVPQNLLAFCKDREAMEAFAKAYKAEQPVIHSAASAVSSRIVGDPKPSNGEIFAKAVQGLL